MKNIVIVDYPLIAEGVAKLLNEYLKANVVSMPADALQMAPPRALVLVELFLPEGRSGLHLIQDIQKLSLDLTPILWTLHPTPFAIWAGLEYKLSGFLDKSIPLQNMRYWFDHALTHGAAWPGDLLDQARNWDEEVAILLKRLTPDLWLLWIELLREKRITELMSEHAWSKRTVERRIAELYMTLGVQSRSEVVSMAWKYGLVEIGPKDIYWSSLVSEFFSHSFSPKEYALARGANWLE
jgi:DNA-binding NarL/FixJ family response regulator